MQKCRGQGPAHCLDRGHCLLDGCQYELAGRLPEGPFEEACQYFSIICMHNWDTKGLE